MKSAAAKKTRTIAVGLCLSLAVGTPSVTHAQEVNTSLPAILRADQVSQDQDLGLIIAKGNVEVAQGDRILLADSLSYNQKSDIITASGHVKLLEPSGEVIFADYMELRDEMREGAIKQIRILLADNARLAASGGRRTGGTHTEMTKAVYSPCDVCKDTPDRPPLWQVKAERVIHDQQTKSIEYHHARLEMFGVPIAYTPYFTHPDPTVKRKSGLLIPSYKAANDYGVAIRLPYFWAIADDKDLTIDPIITTKGNPILGGEYRQAFDNGELNIQGSITVADRQSESGNTETDKVRGHLFAKGLFDIDETWRWGFDYNRATDKTYLDKYDFFDEPDNTLTSKAYLEGFRQRNYTAVQAYTFQDLREGGQYGSAPVILPLVTYQGLGEADRFGGRWEMDAGFRGLSQSDESQSVRGSLKGGYSIPFSSDLGYITTASVSVRADVYQVEHDSQNDPLGRKQNDGFAGRVVPRASLDWRYPFARYGDLGTTIVEPTAGLFVAPNGGNPADIRNDDSTVVEEDATNLFSESRTPGLDRIEGGTRAAYGMKLGHYFTNDRQVEVFLGQSYRFTKDHDLMLETGIEDGQSDYFGIIDLIPHRYVDVNYNFALNEKDLKPVKQELTMRLGPSAFQVYGRYSHLTEPRDPDVSTLEELYLALYSKVDDNWSGSLFTRQDLDGDESANESAGTLKSGMTIRYEDECFIFDGSFTRSFLDQNDVSKDDSLFFRLTFKTLGEVEL